MPAKSRAQFVKMILLHKQGKITAKQLKNFIHGVDYKKLPARVKRQK